MRVVDSRNDVVIKGMTIWVGAGPRESEVVTKQLAGKNAACVVMPNLAAKSTLMSGK